MAGWSDEDSTSDMEDVDGVGEGEGRGEEKGATVTGSEMDTTAVEDITSSGIITLVVGTSTIADVITFVTAVGVGLTKTLEMSSATELELAPPVMTEVVA